MPLVLRHSFRLPGVFALLGLCVGAFLLPAVAQADSQQRIRNGTFDDLLQHWVIEQHAPAVADATISDGPDGLRALTIEVVEPGDADWKVQILQRGIPLRSDKRYRVTFQARSSVKRWIGSGVSQAEAPYRMLAYHNFEVGPEWTRVTFFLRPDSDAALGRFVISGLGAAPAVFAIADVSMIED